MRILLVASSSGGHVYIAKHFGEYLSKCNIEHSYLGIKGEIEENIFPKKNTYFLNIPKSFKKSFKEIRKLIKCRKDIKSIVKEYDVIIGFGGFITAVVSMFINNKKQLFYLHEANVEIGDSNRFCYHKAKRLFTSFQVPMKKNKITFVCNPVIYNIKKIKTIDNISFVFGSLGSKTLLDKTIEYINDSNEIKYKFMLITSDKYYEYTINKIKNKSNVEIRKYIDRDELYSSSKLIFCRGGASTLMEIIASKSKAVIVPSPYVKHNHQVKNTEYLYSKGIIEYVNEKDFDNEHINLMIDKLINKNITMDNSEFKLNPEIEMLQYILNDYVTRK